MLPLFDTIPSRTFPFINWVIIVACILIFLAQFRDQNDGQSQLVEEYGMIPQRVLHPAEPVVIREEVILQTPAGYQRGIREHEAAPISFNPWWTLLTCVFLHGGWLHVIGNLWMLRIFGDNVEDCFGHWGYVLFYLLCGVVASLTHLLTNMGSTMPTIGASGAIAGVMGAYMVLYPRAQVIALVPILFFLQVMTLPAPLFLGLWFVMQFFSGVAAITSMEAAGVAWWAHIGGFLTGMLLAWELKRTRRVEPQSIRRIPDDQRYRLYRYGQW